MLDHKGTHFTDDDFKQYVKSLVVQQVDEVNMIFCIVQGYLLYMYSPANRNARLLLEDLALALLLRRMYSKMEIVF